MLTFMTELIKFNLPETLRVVTENTIQPNYPIHYNHSGPFTHLYSSLKFIR